MTDITDQELLRGIQDGFETAFRVTDSFLDGKDSAAGPGRLSSKFVYEVGRAVHACIARRSRGCRLRVIKVEDGGKREPGEWLVDACVTMERAISGNCPFIERIVFAMESESNTGKRAFNDDFAKLVHLEAKHKLYMNGLNHRTAGGMETYMEGRREYAEAVLDRFPPSGEFYLGFWPSPEKPRNSARRVDSIWRRLQSGEWPHLNGIRLWRFDRRAGRLVEVRPEAG